MTWEWSSVRTKVAQRLVLLFVICALAPLCAFALLGSWMVTRETRAQLQQRLHVDAKAAGMSTVERITQSESRLRLTAEIIATDLPGARDRARRSLDGFDDAWLLDPSRGDAGVITLIGINTPPPAPTDAQLRRLTAGETVIGTRAAGGHLGVRVDMALRVAVAGRADRYLIASQDVRKLWDLGEDSTRPMDVEACVLDEHQAVLACSDLRFAPDRCVQEDLKHGSGVLAWQAGGHDLLGGYWSAPLAGQFHLASWTFVLIQSGDSAAASTATFRRAFVVVGALTFGLIALISLRQIRRRLEPLERLHDSAERISTGDFDARARIESGDEFEALAVSFNRMADEIERRFADLRALSVGTFEALGRAIDAKSPWTAGHSQRVTWLGVRIGQQLGLPADEIETLRYGGLLHDIGKLGVPGRILDKAGKLTPAEAKIIRRHPDMGARILEPIAAYAPMIPIVLEHHERYDGSGYPRHLQGHQISLGGRIFAVADVVDAMLSDRPYRPGIALDRVIHYIADNRGKHFDPQIVDAFLQIVGDVRTQYGSSDDVENVAKCRDIPRISHASRDRLSA